MVSHAGAFVTGHWLISVSFCTLRACKNACKVRLLLPAIAVKHLDVYVQV